MISDVGARHRQIEQHRWSAPGMEIDQKARNTHRCRHTGQDHSPRLHLRQVPQGRTPELFSDLRNFCDQPPNALAAVTMYYAVLYRLGGKTTPARKIEAEAFTLKTKALHVAQFAGKLDDQPHRTVDD